MANNGTSFTNRVNNFIRRNKSTGADGLKLVFDLIQHFLRHRDWDQLARLLTSLDASDNSKLRRIVGEVVGGVRFITDKKHAAGGRFIVGDNFGPTEKMSVLKDMVDNNVSFRSKTVSDALFERNETVKDEAWRDKQIESFAKKMASAGFEPTDWQNRLNNLVKEMVEEKRQETVVAEAA